MIQYHSKFYEEALTSLFVFFFKKIVIYNINIKKIQTFFNLLTKMQFWICVNVYLL